MATTPLDQLLTANQILKLRYYLEPDVQSIIRSGQAQTVINGFLAGHPKIYNCYPQPLRFLKLVILASIPDNDDYTTQIIQELGSIPDLLGLTQQLNLSTQPGFGAVVKLDIAALYQRYRTSPPNNELEAQIYYTLIRCRQCSLDQLKEMEQSFKLASQLNWDQAELANSASRQVVRFLLHHRFDQRPLKTVDDRVTQLNQFSLAANSASDLAATILSFLPQDRDNGLYRDLMIIAERLLVEPLQNIIAFLDKHDLDLGQHCDDASWLAVNG